MGAVSIGGGGVRIHCGPCGGGGGSGPSAGTADRSVEAEAAPPLPPAAMRVGYELTEHPKIETLCIEQALIL